MKGAIEMIDTKLIVKAKQKSKEIEIIDSSWREYVGNLKQNIFTIPFKGNYSALIEENSILVEGYCGLLVIDKVYFSHKTYLLKNPIRYEPFRIYGVYDSKAWFEHFIARPEIGFHYMGISGHGHAICTGDIQYPWPDSLNVLKETSSKIINSFRLINMESMGTVLLPDEHRELKEIFSNKDEDTKIKFEKLLKERLIEEIL